MSLAILNSVWALAFLTSSLDALYSSQIICCYFYPLILCLSLAEKILVYPHRIPGNFVWLPLQWLFPELGGDSWKLKKFCWAPFHPWEFIPKNSSKKFSEEAKVCFPEVQGCDLSFQPTSCPQDPEPPPQCHCREGCLWPSHSQQSLHCGGVWGSAEHLFSLSFLSLWGVRYLQCTPRISWIAFVLLYCSSNRYWSGWSSPWEPGSANVGLLLSICQGPHPFVLPVDVACSRHSEFASFTCNLFNPNPWMLSLVLISLRAWLHAH